MTNEYMTNGIVPDVIVPDVFVDAGYSGWPKFKDLANWLLYQLHISIEIRPFPNTRKDKGYYAYVRKFDRGMVKQHFTLEAPTKKEVTVKAVDKAKDIYLGTPET